jgi:CBS domain-containing protein
VHPPTPEGGITRWLRSKPANPSRLPQPTQPRFGRHKTLFFARCGSPAVSHLLGKPFEIRTRRCRPNTSNPCRQPGTHLAHRSNNYVSRNLFSSNLFFFRCHPRGRLRGRLLRPRAERGPVHVLLILPFIGVKPDERVEQALLRFAQTADREFAVEDGEGRLIGTLALLDLVLAEEGGR